MARSMWRGAIQFGLVTIPVKLYLATEARGGLSFNLLHKTCLQRINMRIHCPEHGEIPRSETVRGFEYSKGQYVIIGDDDFDNVPLKTVRSIEIALFVDASRDSHGANFVRQAYYLEPEAIGRKAFFLLKSVLADEGLSAICKIVLKDREQLAALNPYSSTMLLSTLYWPDEVRALDDLDLPEAQAEFKPAEIAMARQLVTAMKGDFSADEYKDDYRQALLAVIEAKVAGQPAAVATPAAAPTRITDLMSVLEASLDQARAARATAGSASAETAEPASIAGGRRRRKAAAQAEPVAAAAEEARPAKRRKTA
jgi:DNA end-binding protein Ku